MKEVKIEKCQYCGGDEFIEVRIASYGGAYVTTGGLRTDALFGIICRDCGSVVRIFCKTPEKLYPKKNVTSKIR